MNVFLNDLRGQIFAMNAIHGIQIGLHEAELIKYVVAEAYRRSSSKYPHGCDSEQFLRLVEDICLEGDPEAPYVAGQAIMGYGARCEGDLCIVLPAPIIVEKCTKADLNRFKAETLLEPTPAPLDWMYALPPSERYFSLGRGMAIGLCWLWFTHENSIAPPDPASLSNSYTEADYYRDLLGLIHRKAAPTGDPDNHLVLLKLPLSVASRRPHFRPTTVEAGLHERFCVKSNDPRAPRTDNYGRTLDLATFAAGAGLRDGAKERVIRPVRDIDLADGEKIEFVPLGPVRLSRGRTIVDNTEAFVSTLQGPIDPAAMLAALC